MSKIITARAVGRERTEEEKRRRHLHGDKGAKFSKGKRMCILGDVCGCVTVMPSKDNLVAEFYEEENNRRKDYGNARAPPPTILLTARPTAAGGSSNGQN